MMDLRNFSYRQHATAEIFQRNGISIKAISEALNLSYSYTNTLLTGLRRPGPQLEVKLQELASQIEGNEKEHENLTNKHVKGETL